MPRTVRPGWSLLLAGVLAASLLACSDDGGDAVDPDDPTGSTPEDTTPATLPEEVEAGRGAMVVDGSAYVLTVRACSLEPVTDPETGVTTELTVDADDGVGTSVSLTRSVTQGAVPSTTDTVTVADTAGNAMVASRAEIDGRFVDLLAEGALTPMLDVDGDVVSGDGVLGPPGARPGDPAARDVSVLLRCPPAG
jgi:hypothetical protein